MVLGFKVRAVPSIVFSSWKAQIVQVLSSTLSFWYSASVLTVQVPSWALKSFFIASWPVHVVSCQWPVSSFFHSVDHSWVPVFSAVLSVSKLQTEQTPFSTLSVWTPAGVFSVQTKVWSAISFLSPQDVSLQECQCLVSSWSQVSE